MAHQEVLDILGCGDLDGLIPTSFLDRFGLNRPGQYGIVCKDVPAKLRELEAAGCRPFVYTRTKGPNWTEWGERRDVRVEMALGYSSHQQIELLGPGRNTDFYQEKIPQDGSAALHHVCVLQQGIDALEQALNDAGYATALSGNTDSSLFQTKFKYFDTRSELGFYLEITEYLLLGRHAPPGEGLISAIGALQRRLGRRGT